jgi:hypothetical protein
MRPAWSVAEVTDIVRQQGDYRKAAQALGEGLDAAEAAYRVG